MQQTLSPKRITSIDLLRGLVMIIMALDHTRDYFHKPAYLYDPTDLAHTTPAIFFTRWITHFCAPVFVFLAGTSAFISGQRKTKKELSIFLLKRGVWLMLLELTLVNFSWFFNPTFSLLVLQVIWVLGLSMVILSALIHLPLKLIFAFGLLLVCSHNLLDNVTVEGNNLQGWGWALLHKFSFFKWNGTTVAVGYPIIPWAGVMALGYCMGKIYQQSFDAAKRKRILMWTGIICIALFFIVRYSNLYGDPLKWERQSTAFYSFLSMLNTNKYPPSLLYLLMTIGPSLLFLSLSENIAEKFSAVTSTYGRVPLFYYVAHVFVLHFFAMLAAQFTGYHWQDMIFKTTWITLQPSLKGYGFSLAVVYIIWIAVVIVLFPFCKKYDAYKMSNKDKWWLSYL